MTETYRLIVPLPHRFEYCHQTWELVVEELQQAGGAAAAYFIGPCRCGVTTGVGEQDVRRQLCESGVQLQRHSVPAAIFEFLVRNGAAVRVAPGSGRPHEFDAGVSRAI